MNMNEFPENPELEAAIFADPENPENWAVYGDWLQTQEDPRGELIALELALETAPLWKRIFKSPAGRIQQIYQQNYERWAPFQNAPETKIVPDFCELQWSRGFVTAARMDDPYMHTHEEAGVHVEEMAESFFQSAEAKFLRSLAFRIFRPSQPIQFKRVLEAMKQQSPFLILDFLRVQANMDQARESLGDLSPLFEYCPDLQACVFIANKYTLGPFQNEGLEKLWLDIFSLDQAGVKNLAGASLPALYELNLNNLLSHKPEILEDRDYESRLEWLEELFGAKNVPDLITLYTGVFGPLDTLLEKLVSSPLLKQLRQLTFEFYFPEPEDVQAILKNQAAFRHLQTLRLNGLSKMPRELLKELKSVIGERLILA